MLELSLGTFLLLLLLLLFLANGPAVYFLAHCGVVDWLID